MKQGNVGGVGGPQYQPNVQQANGAAPAAQGPLNVPIGQGGAQDYGTMGFTKTSAPTFEESGFFCKPEDIKAACDEKGISHKKFLGKNKTQDVANTVNEFNKMIFEYAHKTGDPEVIEAAKEFMQNMPKVCSNDKNARAAHRNACLDQFNAFKAKADLIAHERESEARHIEGEITADLRKADSDQLTIDVGSAIIGEVDKKAEETKQVVREEGAATREVVREEGASTRKTVRQEGAATRNTVRQEGAATRNTVRQEGAATREVVREEGAATREHVTKEHEATREHVTREHEATRGVVREEGAATREHVTKEHEVTRDVVHKEGTATREHVTKEVTRGVAEVNTHTDENTVLTAKRQTLTDMLVTEQVEKWPTAGHYRDSTIQWLGSAADRIMGNNKLTQAQKEQALDELVRMVDEEVIISSNDKKKFENTYLR